MAGKSKEPRPIRNVPRIKVDKEKLVQFEGFQYGYDNVNGVPEVLRGVRFTDAATLAECRFADQNTMETAARREFNLKRQQKVKAYFLSDAALALIEAGKADEAIAEGQRLWSTYTYTLGAASAGTGKVKVSRSELDSLKAQAAKMAEMEAELAALRAAKGKK